MKKRIENVLMVIAIIMLIVGVTTAIPAYIEKDLIVLIIDFIIIVIGVILFASVFDTENDLKI